MKFPSRASFHYTLIFWIILLAAAPGFVGAESQSAMRELSLEEAFRIALENNQQINVALQQFNQVRSEVEIARSPLFPQVNVQAEAIRQKEVSLIGGPDRYRQASIQATQSIYQGGKLWSDYAASRYFAESNEFNFYRTRQVVLFEVARNYYNVLLARRSIDIARNQLTRAQRQLQLAEQRLEVGLVDQTAVLRARVQAASAREEIERSRNQYTVAMERLALELGISDPPASLQEPESLQLAMQSTANYIDLAFENRRDLKAAMQIIKAAEEQIDSEQADYIPDISLQGSYTKADDDEVFYGTDSFWQVDLIASYPLFTGFRRSAQVTRAEAVKAENQARLQRLRQEIRLDVRSAYADIQTRKKVITSLEDQVESAQANYRQVTAQFEEGLASAVDVVDAETALNEAELRLANTYYQYQLDQLNLKVASGIFVEELLQ